MKMLDLQDCGFDTPCWVWLGFTDSQGYGRLSRGDRKSLLAYRWYYEQANGAVPVGLELDHLCRVRACVNPAHLEAVTHTENMRRGATTKLSLAQVREIRAFRDEFFRRSPVTSMGTPRKRLSPGMLEDLCRQYGVSKPTMVGVLAGRSWLEESVRCA